MTTPQPRLPQRPRWPLPYFVLAGLNLLTLLGAFYLNHRMYRSLEESVEVERKWADRIDRYWELGRFATAVDLAGNDVFVSRDVAAETSRMTRAFQEFDLRLAAARADLAGDGGADAAAMLGRLGNVETAMREMVREASLVFSYFGAQQPDKAAECMAALDRVSARLNAQLAEIRDDIARIQSVQMNSQAELARLIRRYEIPAGGLICLLAAGAVIYGVRRSRERAEAEAELRESEDRYRSLVTGMNDGIFACDASGLLTFANPAAARLMGLDRPEEVVGRNWLEFIAPAKRDEILEYFRALETGRTCEAVIVEIVRRDGTSATAEVRSVPSMDDGRVSGFKGVIRDITERKRTEAALMESEQRFNEIATTIHDAFWVADIDIIENSYISPAYEWIWGRTTASLRENPRSFLDAIHPEDRPRVLANLEAKKSGLPFAHEYRILRPDGAIRWIADAGFPVPEPSSVVRRYVGIARDVTDRVRADEALQQSLRDKEMLLKEVHHRVKNSLNLVASLARIEARRAGHEVTKSVLTEMQNRIVSIALLHETLYRSEAARRVDLAAYVSHLAQQLVRSLAIDSGTVRLNLDLTPLQVDSDQAISCGLIVNELVTNALKHGFHDGRAGEVTVRLREADDGAACTLLVSDDGAGLPADFDAKQKGSLGLQLVADLARQLQGSLWIGPGPAAVFEVTFTPTLTQATVEIPPLERQYPA